MRGFLQQEIFPEREALIRPFIRDTEVVGDQATPTYAISEPSVGVKREDASSKHFVTGVLPPSL